MLATPYVTAQTTTYSASKRSGGGLSEVACVHQTADHRPVASAISHARIQGRMIEHSTHMAAHLRA